MLLANAQSKGFHAESLEGRPERPEPPPANPRIAPSSRRAMIRANVPFQVIARRHSMPDDPETPAAAQTSPSPASGAVEPEWDEVCQASWESFPASDPPAWIGRARDGRPADGERRPGTP